MRLLAANIMTIAMALLTLLNVSCTQTFTYDDYKYKTPENVGDGLATGTLEEANIHAKYIDKAVHAIQGGKHKEVHSMLMYKNDKLVFEEYFQGHIFQWDAPKYYGELVQWNKI